MNRVLETDRARQQEVPQEHNRSASMVGTIVVQSPVPHAELAHAQETGAPAHGLGLHT